MSPSAATMTAAVTGAESPIMDWSRFGIAEVEARFATSVLSGLTEAEAHRRQSQYGPNEVQDRGTPTAWRLVLAQFTGVLTLVLLAAGVLSVVLGDLVDAGAIAAIVVLNATLGFFQEYRAERSMAALRRLAAPRVRVRRGGQTLEIPAPELVPGDVVIVETGNVVPADARLLRSSTLRVQEAALTGESEAVEKDADVVLSMAGPLGDRRNMLYSGTLVAYGHGEAVVTATGMATELGRIASLLQSVQHSLTPLQRRLDELGRQLAVAASVLVLVVFTLGLLNGEPWRDMLLVAVSLAVAAIPEALTAVVTIALALGAQRMLARRALVRRLPAVEALGSVQVICSDKTGTLTQNRMTVTVLDLAAGRVNFAQRPERVGLCLAATDRDTNLLPDVDILLMGGALCNDAVLQHDPSEPEVHRALGDPTEGALVLAAACSGILQSETRHAFPRVAELPFDSVRKRMTTVHHVPHSTAEVPSGLAGAWKRWTAEGPAPRYLAATKGALDGMLAVASAAWVEGRPQPIDSALRARIMSAHDELARQGLRILGIALRPLRPVMITGDHPLTARHVARTIGISADDACLTGQELDERTDAELRGLTREISVFARVSPEHKIRLVQAFQHDGQIVAMTGDGVNDAPALKKADIGLVAFRARDTHWQTLVFTTLVFSSLALAVAVRSEKVSFWRRPFSNPALAGAIALTVVLQLAAVYVPFLQTLLRTTPLPGTHMLVAFMAGGVVLLSVEFWKWLLRRS